MKTIITTIILLMSFISFAQNDKKIKKKEITFEVNGNCEMCKERIENALDMRGVKFAEWSIETHQCKIIYNPQKINEDEIHVKIAEVGHDTEKVKATNEAYNNLHGCCLYERK